MTIRYDYGIIKAHKIHAMTGNEAINRRISSIFSLWYHIHMLFTTYVHAVTLQCLMSRPLWQLAMPMFTV